MKLLLDANISWRITRSLCVNFPESAHILDFFEHHTEDAKIWDLASKEGFVIVSNDEDFSDLVMSKGFPPKVILLKTGNQSNTYILELLKLKQTEIESFYKHPHLGVLVIK
jgi:predicted nuclease of predicted toxin-antitoxin system